MSASLIAWYVVATASVGLFAAGESEGTGDADAEFGAPETAELWGRGRRALVIAALPASFSVVAGLAVLVLTAETEWPQSSTAVIVYSSQVAAAFDGLASLVPIVATVVVFRRVLDVWRDLIYADDPADTPSELTS
jgi:hypothetical protein